VQFRKYDRHREFAQERDEFGVAVTVMPHFDDVTQRAAIEPVRQQFEKAAQAIANFGMRQAFRIENAAPRGIARLIASPIGAVGKGKASGGGRLKCALRGYKSLM
jgi:hypothetical protein